MQLHLQVNTHTYAHYITLCFQVHVLILFPPSIFMVLTGAMDVALGSAATGVFTNSDWLWERLHKVMSEITHNLVVFLYFLEHVLVTIKSLKNKKKHSIIIML